MSTELPMSTSLRFEVVIQQGGSCELLRDVELVGLNKSTKKNREGVAREGRERDEGVAEGGSWGRRRGLGKGVAVEGVVTVGGGGGSRGKVGGGGGNRGNVGGGAAAVGVEARGTEEDECAILPGTF
ncbi:hypothetical protein LIER_31329 [Lithospermum erythrorhizon]|uniref:Uncharacterized protein n=1 Tax=Lithospermum erythrorhizon TaxID=34254 RepID=A0AAV3RSY7_LITER